MPIRHDVRPRVLQSAVVILGRFGMEQGVDRHDGLRAADRLQVIAQKERQVLRCRVVDQAGAQGRTSYGIPIGIHVAQMRRGRRGGYRQGGPARDC